MIINNTVNTTVSKGTLVQRHKRVSVIFDIKRSDKELKLLILDTLRPKSTLTLMKNGKK